MSKTAFVTGGTGFVGQNLLIALVQRGWEVKALCRRAEPPASLRGLDIEWCTGDVTDSASLASAMPGAVDAVFHVAGDTRQWRGFAEQVRAVNVTGVRNVLELARRRSVGRFVYTSTAAVFEGDKATIRDGEAFETAPEELVYAHSKQLGHRAVLAAAAEGLDAVLVLPAVVLGRYDESGWVALFRAVAAGTPNYYPGQLFINHVDDVVDTHLAAFERGVSGHGYLVQGFNVSAREAMQAFARLAGAPPPETGIAAPALLAMAEQLEKRAEQTGKAPVLSREFARVLAFEGKLEPTRVHTELGMGPARNLNQTYADLLSWIRVSGAAGQGVAKA